MKKYDINSLSGSVTLPLFETTSERMPIAVIQEVYLILEFLYSHNMRKESFQLLWALISLSKVEWPEEYLEIENNAHLAETFAGEVLADLKEILNEYR